MTDVLKAYYLMSSVQRKGWGGKEEKENAVKVKQDCFLLKDLSPFQNNIGTFRVKDHTGSLGGTGIGGGRTPPPTWTAIGCYWGPRLLTPALPCALHRSDCSRPGSVVTVQTSPMPSLATLLCQTFWGYLSKFAVLVSCGEPRPFLNIHTFEFRAYLLILPFCNLDGAYVCVRSLRQCRGESFNTTSNLFLKST